MKYWKLMGTQTSTNKYYEVYSSKDDTSLDNLVTFDNGATVIRVSEQEYNLRIKYDVNTPEINPTTGQPWVATQVPGEPAGTTSVGFDPARLQHVAYLTWKEEVKGKGDKGQLMDDIAIWHNVFSETLIKIIIFRYNTEVAMRVKFKVISDIIAKYNLDLVIKDFKPDYAIPADDKSKLIEGLKEIEAYDDGIYNRMAQAVGLEYGALHNEVVDAYERIMQTLHPEHFTGTTLAAELANSHTGAKK